MIFGDNGIVFFFVIVFKVRCVGVNVINYFVGILCIIEVYICVVDDFVVFIDV